jgi:hypothetical protein
MMFQKLDLFPSSGEGGEKTPTQLGPLERANLNHWTAPVRVTQLFNHWTMEKVQKPSNSVRNIMVVKFFEGSS